MEGVMLIVLVVLGIIIYFVPSIVAKNKKNLGAILCLNIFLGWTVLGWVGALVWACASPEEKRNEEPQNYSTKEHSTPAVSTPQPVQQTPQPQHEALGVADELLKLAKLKEAGALTDEEFNAQKAKLLK